MWNPDTNRKYDPIFFLLFYRDGAFIRNYQSARSALFASLTVGIRSQSCSPARKTRTPTSRRICMSAPSASRSSTRSASKRRSDSGRSTRISATRGSAPSAPRNHRGPREDRRGHLRTARRLQRRRKRPKLRHRICRCISRRHPYQWYFIPILVIVSDEIA